MRHQLMHVRLMGPNTTCQKSLQVTESPDASAACSMCTHVALTMIWTPLRGCFHVRLKSKLYLAGIDTTLKWFVLCPQHAQACVICMHVTSKATSRAHEHWCLLQRPISAERWRSVSILPCSQQSHPCYLPRPQKMR